jgi:radical SAM protein with 4Fe4S-binding SPASM domain
MNDLSVPSSSHRSVSYSFPRTVYIELEYGCNIRCSYCYIGEELNFRKRVVPPAADWVRVLGILHDWGAQEIILLGGEPTMHPDFLEVVGEISRLNFASRGLVTNGTLLDDRKIAALEAGGFWLDLTVRASTETRWSEVTRSRSTWARYLNGMRLLGSSSLSLALEFDCGTKTADDLYDSVALAVSFGIQPRHVQLHRVLPMGDALSSSNQALAARDWDLVLEQGGRVESELGVPVMMEDGLPFCLVAPSHWHRLLSCACGSEILTLGPDMRFRRCACDTAAIASISDPRENVCEATRRATEARPVPDACRNCPALEVCHSGCSASRAGSNGTLPDAYLAQLSPISPAVWAQYQGAVRSAHLIGQEVR